MLTVELLLISILWIISTGRIPNVFTNIARGEAKVYVRDAYNCVPVEVNITVPNLINIITPNDDGINDFVDYSALANKQNLEIAIFDRYGYKMFQADKTNGYKWAGTTNGHKKSLQETIGILFHGMKIIKTVLR